jgi:hypothetical protein
MSREPVLTFSTISLSPVGRVGGTGKARTAF